MADILDTLLGAGKAVAAVPQAVGGTALDILIGDRTNVSGGEQAKRAIEALLFAGDNPGNLIALRQMNAREDASREAVINTPEFRRTMSVMQTTRDLTPMEAFDATAKIYGVQGYRPQTSLEAVDAAPGGPSLPERQPVPILPPLSAIDLSKELVAQRQYRSMTEGDQLDQLQSQYDLAGVKPPMDIQRAQAQRAIGDEDRVGLTTRTIQWKDGSLGVTIKDLAPDEQFFSNEERAKDAALYQNKYREAIGDPVRVGLAVNPSGGYSLIEMQSPEGSARGSARGRVIGTAEGELAPATVQAREEAAKRPTQATRSQAQQTLQNIDSTVPLIDTFLGALRPENVGLLGKLRGAAFGIKGQLDAALGTDAAAALQTLRAQIQEDAFANNLKPGDGGVTPTLFDPNLETTNLIGNVLAYRMARINNPDGKISDADVRDAKTSLEFDQPFTSAAQVQQRVKVFRSMLEQQRAAAASVLKSQATDASPMRGGDGGEISPIKAKLLQKFPGRR